MAQTAGENMTASENGTKKANIVDLAGSKLRKKLGSSLQESAAAPTSDFAKKQLEKMGWTEGTGLGKKRDGMKTHIRVTRRQEQSGLGSEKAAAEQRQAGEQWWKDSLGDTLARLGKKNKKGSASKKRRREVTDEDLFEATGGARFGMRAAPSRKLAKWRRGESDISDSSSNKPVLVEPPSDDSSLTNKTVSMEGVDDGRESKKKVKKDKKKKSDKKKKKKDKKKGDSML